MTKPKTERPCGKYVRTSSCKDDRDHCFNCARHLDEVTGKCPKRCGEISESALDAANNED